MIHQQSYFIENDNHRIHLRMITPQAPTSLVPVLMLHGAIEDGRIFYSKSGKGLACELARAGHPVYVIDMRGRGLSTPSIGSSADKSIVGVNNHGQHESIVETLPQCHQWVLDKHPQHTKIHWMAHSWGGVIMASSLARFSHLQASVASQVFFGTKRVIHKWSFERAFKVELIWKRLAPMIAKHKGYFPFKALKIGSENETYLSLNEGQQWVRDTPWVDHRDGFDYGTNAKQTSWPKTWFIAAKNDPVLGHPIDVKTFVEEVGAGTVTILSKENGNTRDYDHINMLTHSSAVDDYFGDVIEFIK